MHMYENASFTYTGAKSSHFLKPKQISVSGYNESIFVKILTQNN